MSTRSLERTSATKGAWVVIILFIGWLVFVFVPGRQPDPPVTAAPEPQPPSKLHEAGLADNVDWEGLPELFAIWADEGRWRDNRVKFAYWNPGTSDYSYFFEATRINGRTTFREIPKPEDYMEFANFYYEGQPASADYPIRFIPDSLWGQNSRRFPAVEVPIRPQKRSSNPRAPIEVSPVKISPVPFDFVVVPQSTTNPEK